MPTPTPTASWPTPAGQPTRSATPPSATPPPVARRVKQSSSSSGPTPPGLQPTSRPPSPSGASSTTAEFQIQQATTQAQLEALADQLEETRAAAQQEQEASEAQSRRILLEAEERADHWSRRRERAPNGCAATPTVSSQRPPSVGTASTLSSPTSGRCSPPFRGLQQDSRPGSSPDVVDARARDRGRREPTRHVQDCSSTTPSVVEGVVEGEGQAESEGEGRFGGQFDRDRSRAGSRLRLKEHEQRRS